MPDNRRTGALEDFLKDLIELGDRLLPHAEASTARAKELGLGFLRSPRRRRSSTLGLPGSASPVVPTAWRSRPTTFVTTATPHAGSSVGSVWCSGFLRVDDRSWPYPTGPSRTPSSSRTNRARPRPSSGPDARGT